jgi:glyoxylase-like metal-dependent hydrolase (beta-lactamase superfamily II)
VREHVLLHRPSRTLIVGDVLFNFGRGGSVWTRLFARHVMRLKKFIGMSPFFRLMIRDREAFRSSVAAMMRWDFDRVIVGHGGIIERGGKERLREVLVTAGLAPPEFERA